MNITKKPKLLQYTDSIGVVRDDFYSRSSLYKRENILSAHSLLSFKNCVNMIRDDHSDKLKVLIVYENLINCNDKNINELKSISSKLDIIVLCGTQASLDYLWENKNFMSIFTELNF